MEKLINLSRKLYEESIRNLIHKKYVEYENKIAVGFSGEGSECFFYDDDISKDHDYEVSLCMWLTDEDYKNIGKQLNEDYIKQVEEFSIKNKIFLKSIYTKSFQKRRGVMTISDFYSNILGIKIDENKKTFSENEYNFIDDSFFATCINGEIFRDELYKFSYIRDVLKKYYPFNVYINKLKYLLHMFSQNGQSNYGRAMARKDYVTANICISNSIVFAMKIICMLEKTYAPYYKWLKKTVQNFGKYDEIINIIDEIVKLPIQNNAWENYKYNLKMINKNDRVEVLIDEIGKNIAKAMYEKNLISEENSKNSFLEGLINKV